MSIAMQISINAEQAESLAELLSKHVTAENILAVLITKQGLGSDLVVAFTDRDTNVATYEISGGGTVDEV